MHQYRYRERLEHGTAGRPWRLYTLGVSQGGVFPCHWHPEWEFLWVARGRLHLTRNQDQVVVGAGEGAFLTGSELHTGASDDPGSLVYALVVQPWFFAGEHRDPVTQRWLRPLEDGALGAPGVLRRGTPEAQLVARMVEGAHHSEFGLEFKGLVYLLLHHLHTGGALVPLAPSPLEPLPRIRQLLQYIEEHFAEPLTVDDLAQRACLSRSQFNRVFRAVTGDTPIHHLIRRRVEEAARLLRDPGATVSEVAFRVGFTNFSHFSRTFRHHWGCSPTAARRTPEAGA